MDLALVLKPLSAVGSNLAMFFFCEDTNERGKSFFQEGWQEGREAQPAKEKWLWTGDAKRHRVALLRSSSNTAAIYACCVRSIDKQAWYR